MIEPTAARDRAIQVVEDALAHLAERIVPDDVAATALVDALLAHPEVLRALAGTPGMTVDCVEWGAKWSDCGYCPSTPPRSEEFARQHARMFGTRPIRREVGPWVYADTGQPAFADQDHYEPENDGADPIGKTIQTYASSAAAVHCGDGHHEPSRWTMNDRADVRRCARCGWWYVAGLQDIDAQHEPEEGER